MTEMLRAGCMTRFSVYFFIILMVPLKIFASDFDNSFLSPDALLYSPQPYKYENNELLFVEVTTEADTLRSLVPEPLIPNSENKLQVYIGNLTIVEPGRLNYGEAGIVIPVTYFDKKQNHTHHGNYFSVLYLDDVSAVVYGREIYGFTKVLADIEFIRTSEKVMGKVSIDGQTIIDIKFDIEQKAEKIQQPTAPWVAYTYKRIPDANLKNDYVVRQIISTPITDFKIHELYFGNAELKLGSVDFNPLGDIPVLAVSNPFFKIDNNVIRAGEVLHDFKQ